MKGKDIRCPEDGTGAVDVEPEYDFSLDLPWMWGYRNHTVYCRCQKGHALKATLSDGPPYYFVEVLGERRK